MKGIFVQEKYIKQNFGKNEAPSKTLRALELMTD